jgi:hypothetical protein
MSEQLIKQSLASPGFFGLNSQDSSEDSDFRFAKVAENVIFDSAGRLAARKGWLALTSQIGSIGSGGAAEYGIAQFGISEYGAPTNMQFIFEFVKESGNVVISAGGGQLYTGTTTHTLMAIKNAANNGNATYTITNDHWQVAAMPYGEGLDSHPHAYFVQANHGVLIYHELPTPGSGNPHAHDSGAFGFQKLDDIGTLPLGYVAGEFKPSCATAAYGRIWVANSPGDQQTIYFSRLLDGTDFRGGDAGSLSLNAVFPNSDEIVALAGHNGFLIIFGKDNIAIYGNPQDVTQMALVDYIPNIGCISRDSVQKTGSDIIFLSRNGLMSLQRVIQEKSLPFRDLSKNVRDAFMADVFSETTAKIKGVYYPKEAFYLLTLPSIDRVYCFDTRSQLQDGGARATLWTGINPTCFCVTENDELLLTRPAYIGKYYGYTDNTEPYRLKYYTNYSNLGSPSNLKILKKLGFSYRGLSNKQFYVFWGFDYKENYRSETKALTGGTVYEYGIAQFGIAEYGDASTKNGNFNINAAGAGNIVQVGLEADVNGDYVALQKIEIFAKQGKVI